jgi:hypothetical protein
MLDLSVSCAGNDLGDVIAFNCFNGRQVKSEMYGSSTASVTFRAPSSMPAAYTIGALVFVNYTTNSSTYALYSGYITNISYNYGIVAEMDTATINLEGYLSFMGRGQLEGFTLTGGTTGAEAVRVGNALTGTVKTVSNQGTKSYTDTSSYTGAAQNIITQLVATEQGRLGQGANALYFYGRDVIQDPTGAPFYFSNWAFTDSAPATHGWAYDEVTFASLTDNYFTQVTINPASYSTQQSGTGSRNLTIDTYDANNTQAANLAAYVLGEFDNNTSVPVSVSTKESMDNYQTPALIMDNVAVGWKLPITLRGTTYNAVIEGWSVTADPQDIRYTVYVSGFQQNNYLLLNDSVYGTLDNNQLGF